ncbi:MAG: hypothetical protein OEZ55_13540 [Nitrospinota bacterium]|nr:hypothetical protein [Nitrospinota bacterium]
MGDEQAEKEPGVIQALLGGSRSWGVSPEEERLEFAVDKLGVENAATLFRGITIDAPAGIVFRWLCQLRAAPYSYDLLDNFGRQSPRKLTPGLENLAPGQTFMFIFDLVDFAQDSSITLRLKSLLSLGGRMGETALSYDIHDAGSGSCRLLVKIAIRYAWGPFGWPTRLALPPGDLIMMRKQLFTLKEMAEQQARSESMPAK